MQILYKLRAVEVFIVALSLAYNIIAAPDPALVQKFAAEFANKSKADLYNKYMSDAEIAALAEALKTNDSMHLLLLSNNNIGDAGASALAEALKVNKTLKILRLTANKIGDKGANAIADALKFNSTLVGLLLNFNNIAKDLIALIDERMDRNKKIAILKDKLAALVPGFKEKNSNLSSLVPDVQLKILKELINLELTKQ